MDALTPKQIRALGRVLESLDRDTRQVITALVERVERADLVERTTVATNRAVTESSTTPKPPVTAVKPQTLMAADPVPAKAPVEPTPLHKLTVDQLRDVHRIEIGEQLAAGPRSPFWRGYTSQDAAAGLRSGFWQGWTSAVHGPDGAV